MYFLYIYKYRTLKPMKVILRRGRGKRENNGRMNQAGIPCMQIWKCHNETLCTTITYQ
jgi:hypothetical protein